MKTSSNVTKGQVLDSPTPWRIVPLSASHADPVSSIASRLPRYDTTMANPVECISSFREDKNLEDFFVGVLGSPSMQVYTLVATIRVFLMGQNASDHTTDCKTDAEIWRTNDLWYSEEEREMACEGWTFVQQLCDWDTFLCMYRHVRAHMHLSSVPHTLTRYMLHRFPLLGSTERGLAVNILRGTVSKEYADATELRLMHAVIDTYQQQPYMYAVLLHSPVISNPSSSVVHSCLPNATWDMNPDHGEKIGTHLSALYDLQAGEEVSVAMVDVSLAYADRTAALRERFGCSESSAACECTRCVYERDGTLPSLRGMERLANMAFQQGRYAEALFLYNIALERDSNLPDIWHALGAVHLQQNHFCKAQQFWKEAAEKHEFLRHHKGIALQLEKQIAYRYWDRRSACSDSSNRPEYISFFRGLCFATTTPILTPDDCRYVITCAEEASGGWTTSRHYAVPTTDVPVHEVHPLLKWFMECMENKIAPLLSLQFACPDQKWYVHDAFVVRYEASRKNNHLPLHSDESTHSLVLALNNGYEGGGTYFEKWDQTLDVPLGNMLSFRGDSLRHGGNVVTKGVRYVLAVFLYQDSEMSASLATPPSQKRVQMQKIFQARKKKKEEEKNSFAFDFVFPSKR